MKTDGGLDELYALKIAAFLHDIGKPESWSHFGDAVWRQRHGFHSHVCFTEEMILECFGEKGRTIALNAKRHHNNQKYAEDCPVEDIEQIIHKGDYLASGADRPEKRKKRDKFYVRLSHPLSCCDAPYFLGPEWSKQDLLGASQEIKTILRVVAPYVWTDAKKACDDLYQKLSRSAMNRIPADTGPPLNDHTLWDHSKLTAAVATCIYFDGGYKGRSARLEDYRFAILAGDTDRVGKFIHKSRKLPDLVARSNTAKLANKKAVEKIVDVLGPECVIFSGGGNFLALSPLCKADELRRLSQEAFENETESQLSVTVNYHVVDGNEFGVFPHRRPSPEEGFNIVWRQTFEKVRNEKRTKIPKRLPDIEQEAQLCDVCLENPASIVDPHHPYFITQDGTRRREFLCKRCHILRDKEWRRGIWMDKYVDENTRLVALFKIDGDDVGDIIEGSAFEKKFGKRASPARLSCTSRLIDNTCRELGDLVEKKYEGRCVYAAGDDLMGVVKGSLGLECIQDLTGRFYERMAKQVTMSAGLVIMKADYPVYVALEALEQLLQNAKEDREEGGTAGSEKAGIDFEVVHQVGLTKKDLELERRKEKRNQHLSHRPYKIRDLREVFKSLNLIATSEVRKNQAAFLTAALSSQHTEGFISSGENVKRASLLVKYLMGRGHVDLETGESLLRSVEDGAICDSYLLAVRVYQRRKA